MIILMLFNKYESISFEFMLSSTGIPESDIKCNIIPLLSKFNIILKSPNNKEFNKSDTFSLNMNFKSNMYRIKVPVAQMKK